MTACQAPAAQGRSCRPQGARSQRCLWCEGRLDGSVDPDGEEHREALMLDRMRAVLDPEQVPQFDALRAMSIEDLRAASLALLRELVSTDSYVAVVVRSDLIEMIMLNGSGAAAADYVLRYPESTGAFLRLPVPDSLDWAFSEGPGRGPDDADEQG